MKNWIKYTVLSVSIGLIIGNATPRVSGCVCLPDENYGAFSFVLTNLSRDSQFKHYYYDANEHSEEYTLEDDQNLKEWESFFGKQLTLKELDQLVYTMPEAELGKLLKSPETTNNKLLRTEYRQALEYLLYAKQCEPYVVADSDWYEEIAELKKRRQPDAMKKMIELGLTGYKKAESVFLKERYAFQVIRLANYAEFAPECISYYNHLLLPLGRNTSIADRGLRHKAGALRKCGNEAESLVQTAMLFDQSNYLRDEAFCDFFIPKELVWEQSLKSAGLKHRQATLWLLRGLKEERFGVGNLQKIVELEPQSSRLEMLLVRYINRLEENYFRTYLFFKPLDKEAETQKAIALKYTAELRRFIAGVDRSKIHEPGLWDSMDAYLAIIEQKYPEAEGLLQKAASQLNQNPTLKNQIELLKALNRVVRSSQMDANVENECVKALTVLEAANENAPNNLIQIKESFYALLAQKYLAVNNYSRGICCLDKADCNPVQLLDYYLTGSDLDGLLAFLTKKDVTPYEKLIMTGLAVSVDDIYSIRGTLWLREEKFKTAATYFSKISPAFWAHQKKNEWGYYEGLIRTSFDKNYYNPKTGLYRYPSNGFPYYTKLEFTQKVLELEQLAVENPAQADRCYYQIANGFFHSPFWACNENISESMLLSYYEYEMDQDSFTGFPFDFQADFTVRIQRGYKRQQLQVGVRTIAQKYYLKAMHATQNKELAARCCFLAQACMTKFAHYREFQEVGKSKYYYFDMLRQQFSDTEYYKYCLKECDTLRQYLNPQPKK